MSDGRCGARDADTRLHGHGHRDRPGGSGDFQSSVQRLERAVSELVTTASDRASSLIDETAERLERELDRRQGRSSRSAERSGRRRSHRHHGSWHCGGYRSNRFTNPSDDAEGPPRRLYRDPARQKIGGVCAGIARYYGMEAWVVRCIAVTGLLFFPTIVFPAYWIAYFVMDKPPRRDADKAADDSQRRRRDHRSPAPELGPRFSPRNSLRNVQADLAEVELRLRRMETHITSGRYELQRELNKIDGGDDGQRD